MTKAVDVNQAFLEVSAKKDTGYLPAQVRRDKEIKAVDELRWSGGSR